MPSSPHNSGRRRCPICGAEIQPANRFCGVCGSHLVDTPAEEIRSLNYLLLELSRWEHDGLVGAEQANLLRESYEKRREELRSRLAPNGQRAAGATPPPEVKPSAPAPQTQTPPNAGSSVERFTPARQPFYPPPVAPLPAKARAQKIEGPRRTLLETLADPQTIRILLYTGAGMLVVGVIIWLRDVLYLKLQEPVVQAGLLAIGTIAVTASGWFATLRTRLRLTGRALTLTGSLLVPVNFWFLVRSGLIENNGRAWMVCAFCTLLYALTAALLREKLYVYLASVAAIATSWTLIYRYEREAFGLYALALMTTSLVFLHLSRLFPLATKDAPRITEDAHPAPDNPPPPSREPQLSRLSYELWGPPLVHIALAGATLGLLFYMTLRLGSTPSFFEGFLQLGADRYDPGVAMMLFMMGAYAAWFAGRHIYTDRRPLLYTTSALALFWTEFLALDGFRLRASTELLTLAATAFVAALAARKVKGEALSTALHRASLMVNVVLAISAYPIFSTSSAATFEQSAVLIFLAATFALASAPRFADRASSEILAHASAVFASASFLIALLSLNLRSETLFYAACAAWPFVLYVVARLTRQLGWEPQLSMPLLRIADAEFGLLLLLASVVAFSLNQTLEDRVLAVEHLRGAMLCVLSASVIYGALRCWRERSVFGAALLAFALLVLVGATGDALKHLGALPQAWPVATAIVIAAFLLSEAAGKWLRPQNEQTSGLRSGPANFTTRLTRHAVINLVADCASVACASLWFTNALYRVDEGGASAAVVLLLALLYWGERARRLRRRWTAYVTAAHAGALCLALLVALRIDTRWFAALSVLALFPLFFAVGRYARRRGAEWMEEPARVAAALTLALSAAASLAQAVPHLNVGDAALLAPCLALGAVALMSFGASFWSAGRERLQYFRAGLYSIVLTFALACLRAGFDPLDDAEVYTTPVAVLLLAVAYLSIRRNWEHHAPDTSALFWAGSLLLAAPLLIHSLEFRLLRDVAAPWRDVATLCASLALLLFGVLGRLRAPVLVGASALVLELAALALTSVDWLQIPLKVYLTTVGAAILLIWGLLEFRREQILALRRRFNQRRETARERFGEWR